MEDKILLIFISSFEGYCAGAEHYYAKLGFVDRKKFDDYNEKYENYAWEFAYEPINDDDELTYYPTEEEARKLVEKDNFLYHYTEKRYKDSIEHYVKDGTRRFPSILKIIEQVEKKDFRIWKWR